MMSRVSISTGLTMCLAVGASLVWAAAAMAQSLEGMTMAARDPSPFPTSDWAPVSHRIHPVSGAQLYQQRLAAWRSNQLYTRLTEDSLPSEWMSALTQPTYEEWKALLQSEAHLVEQVPASSRLCVLLGDSLSLWMPSGGLPESPVWLNQGISGDTTRGILDRLSALAGVDPDRIYLLAGINDLKNGLEDAEIVSNYRQILRQLQADHPDTEVMVQSILPTRGETIPNDRIRQLNRQLAAIAQQEGANFLDLSIYLTDARGELHPSLTTDGLHLNDRGYETWQWVLQQVESGIAMN